MPREGDGGRGGEGPVSVPSLTIYNQHTAACGTPPAFSNESADLSIGHFANRYGEQWIFTFDRATGAASLRGGLKSFRHPIGASGLRMLFEAWLQLRGEAGPRLIASLARGRKLAMTHNLGGAPGECVSFVSIVGSERSA